MMKALFSCLVLIVCFGCTAFGQTEPDPKSKKLFDDAAKNGNGLQTRITVNGNVHVQAVLIPRVDANRIFGKEIANNYAVIELNIGNKSPDAALIIHGVFIDYSEWPLSGSSRSVAIADRSSDSYQESNFPSQVASVENRVVRGQLLDAQSDTWRNRLMRWLTLAGNLAGAFTFSINEQGIVKGIAAATGVGIPGVATAWPDRTIDQLNRVSDFGFHSPKLVPKQGSEVIVCFFPIDRFLTPGFRNLFLKSPALFFAPGLMLADKSVEKDVNAIVVDLGLNPKELRKSLPCYEIVAHKQRNDPAYPICLQSFALHEDPKTGILSVIVEPATEKAGNLKKFENFMAINFLGSVSLNRVTITVDGVMAVEINDVAARIDEVEFSPVEGCGDQKTQCFWTDLSAGDGVRKGIIHGAYLKGAELKLAEVSALSIDDVKPLTEESTDDALHFSFKLTKRLSSQTKLHFAVTKEEKRSDNVTPRKLESNTWEYLVDYPTSGPSVGKASLSSTNKELTVTGQSFLPDPKVTVRSEGEELEVPSDLIKDLVKDKFTITDVTKIPNIHGGCWDVHVEVNGVFSNNSSKFEIEPNPTIDSVKREGKVVTLEGKDLFDSTSCGGNVTFKFVETGSTTAITLKPQGFKKGKSVKFELPSDLQKDGLTGKVQIIRNGNVISEKELTSP